MKAREHSQLNGVTMMMIVMMVVMVINTCIVFISSQGSWGRDTLDNEILFRQ